MEKTKERIKETAPSPLQSARKAGLRYIQEGGPGISRKRRGKGFVYLNSRGKIIRSPGTLARIAALVIPPAWREVWICPDPRGHLQAVGLDDRGRKQYRYHAQWRETRDQNKYDKMIDFGKALPSIRRRLARDLRLPGLPREKVLATVVKLLETTLIRIGNEEYTRQNNSFGLTTLRDKHVKVNGSQIHFEFRGKSGVHREVDLNNKRLARIVRKCQDLPGFELFQYVDEAGKRHDVGSADVNAYLKEITGEDFTAKDFRTWAGTILAAAALQAEKRAESEAQIKRNIAAAVASVAQRLGNTKAVCRKCYIHPRILESYVDGSLAQNLAKRGGNGSANASGNGSPRPVSLLKAQETAVLALLRRRLANNPAAG